ncbi:hypothetical protein QGP82_05790 [Leptothoe sp. LEGE 181152]|nr:hypothetical protein [Leptothoe sp. LEGE 181152]
MVFIELECRASQVARGDVQALAFDYGMRLTVLIPARVLSTCQRHQPQFQAVQNRTDHMTRSDY